jgi:2-hydroxychromene-2-carboxylate isomerase
VPSASRIAVTHFTDPGCPWAYSAGPSLAVLRWRYGDQLDWRLVTIGLTEHARQYEERGYTPALAALGYRRFRRYGMPFAVAPRARMTGTGRACRAIVAVRLSDPAREWEAFRALQFAWFTTTLLLDEDDGIASALEAVAGLDVAAVLSRCDDASVEAAYQADRAEARTAAGSPTELQGKAAASDGPVRYTAPSVVFARGDRMLEAGGFQPVEAYDVLVANLDPALSREPPAAHAGDVLRRFPEGVTTQEVAAVLASGNDAPDRDGAEAALIELAATTEAERVPLGDDALWRLRRS